MAGFLRRTLEVKTSISRRNLSMRACITEAYSSSTSEGESDREGWKNDSSSESKEETELTLLTLDIEETLADPESLAERRKGSMDTS